MAGAVPLCCEGGRLPIPATPKGLSYHFEYRLECSLHIGGGCERDCQPSRRMSEPCCPREITAAGWPQNRERHNAQLCRGCHGHVVPSVFLPHSRFLVQQRICADRPPFAGKHEALRGMVLEVPTWSGRSIEGSLGSNGSSFGRLWIDSVPIGPARTLASPSGHDCTRWGGSDGDATKGETW